MDSIPESQRACATLLTEQLGAPCGGDDSAGRHFKTIKDLWDAKLPAREQSWYRRGSSYWNEVPADDFSGVLGGQQHVHDWDVEVSTGFLSAVVKSHPAVTSGIVLDCGAGMGRVSSALLCNHWPEVHLLEPSPRLLASARRKLAGQPHASRFIEAGLQEHDFRGSGVQYSCVWMQWVAGALLDVDLLRVLSHAASSLCAGGLIIVKENVTRARSSLSGGRGSAPSFWYDDEDAYLVRGADYMDLLFELAGLRIVSQADQPKDKWDPELMPVRMWALAPSAAEPADSGASSSS